MHASWVLMFRILYRFLRHGERLTNIGALVRDRGSQCINTFDEICRTERFKILKPPVRAPVTDTSAERWIGTLRRELLDRTIIWNQRQLERPVIDHIEHYNVHTARSASNHPDQPSKTRQPASLHCRSESPEPHAVTASSTNTETPLDQPRSDNGHPHGRQDGSRM